MRERERERASFKSYFYPFLIAFLSFELSSFVIVFYCNYSIDKHIFKTVLFRVSRAFIFPIF